MGATTKPAASAVVQELPLEEAPASAVARRGDTAGVNQLTVPADGGQRGSITQLLHLAIEKGTPVEALEKLVGLHERLADREAAQEFARALAAFQAECPPITHSKKAKIVTSGGGSYSYTYAELDAIARVVNPILAKHGLSYSWNTAVDEKNRLTCDCIVRHINGHIALPATFSLPIDNKSAMSEQQKVGAAATFAKRQSLIAALGITTSDDDFDGAAAAAVDPTPVNAAQLRTLENLLDEAGADPEKFLKYLDVEALKDLPAVRFQEAKAALLEKKKARARS